MQHAGTVACDIVVAKYRDRGFACTRQRYCGGNVQGQGLCLYTSAIMWWQSTGTGTLPVHVSDNVVAKYRDLPVHFSDNVVAKYRDRDFACTRQRYCGGKVQGQGIRLYTSAILWWQSTGTCLCTLAQQTGQPTSKLTE
jgi:hypothetical protein